MYLDAEKCFPNFQKNVSRDRFFFLLPRVTKKASERQSSVYESTPRGARLAAGKKVKVASRTVGFFAYTRSI